MNTFFIGTIVVLCLYIIFKDLVHRKDLEGKDMVIQDLVKVTKSKSPEEYLRYKAEEPKEMEDNPDPYREVWDLTEDEMQRAISGEGAT